MDGVERARWAPGALARPLREERDEFAPLHSMTSSAARKQVGRNRQPPSTFAVLRLITNSNLAGTRPASRPAWHP